MAETELSVPDRDLFAQAATIVAPLLLGSVLRHHTDEGVVAIRLTEVEAYLGVGNDPGSHAYRGRRKRNATMFGPPGHLYVYFTYGMHACANVVCSRDGVASAVLLRAGRVIEGVSGAVTRRQGTRETTIGRRDLARGPARLTRAMDLTLRHDGADVLSLPFELLLPGVPSPYASGPRTGVSGPGGSTDYPWRYWIPGDETVSAYRAHVPKRPR